jgi:hypothetical protein
MAKEFGLESVQGKQKIQGKRSGTSWVIDAKEMALPSAIHDFHSIRFFQEWPVCGNVKI